MSIVHIQAMLDNHRQYQLRKQTIKWYYHSLTHGYNNYHFKILHKILCDQTQTHITYDSRFADAIIYSLNLMLCITFEDQQRELIDLTVFVRMAEQLHQKGLIGRRHVQQIKNFKLFNIANKINEFMSLMSVGKFTAEEMEQQWQQVIGVSLAQFWKAVMRQKVKQVILVTLYDFMKGAPAVNKSAEIGEYVQGLRYGQQKEGQYTSVKYVRQFKQQKQQELNQTRDQNHWEQLSIARIKRQHTQMQQVEVRLKQIAYYYSMFLNPAHQNNLANLNRLIHFVQNSIFLRQGYRLQLFGSLKSTFALSNSYDIDFNFASLQQQYISRQMSISVLNKIQNDFRNKVIPWFKKSQVCQFKQIAMPFLKITLNPYQFRRCFGIQNITKIDFTVGNRTAVINSVILSHYSQIPQIHFFCILVKVWAKSRNVINTFKPYNGLSSYVVILMCLYYLMETGQIDFIEISEQELNNIEAFVPNIRRVQMVGLYQNFKGFLQFYAEAGPFQKQKKVVCLMKGTVPKQQIWQQDFIVNVYDFIDRTNPGRLLMQHRNFQFYQFRRALHLLKEKTIPKINEIFQSS